MAESPRVLWGWTTPARVLLGLVAVAGGAALLVVDSERQGAARAVPRLVVDPNTAPRPVLGALPKLGPALTGRIVAARNEQPFRSIDDLDGRVRGIGPATLEALRPYLRIVLQEPPPAASSRVAHNVNAHAR